MKKFCISLALIAIIIVTVIAALPLGANAEYLRIHIRANSDSECDQSVKYAVRDAVTAYLTPFVAQCRSKSEAFQMLESNLSDIEFAANSALKDNGFLYTAKACLRAEEFPTRVYDGFTLEEGVYDALILELGNADGKNWWCVIYPPLCFVRGGNGYVYKSKILEIIRQFEASKN